MKHNGVTLTGAATCAAKVFKPRGLYCEYHRVRSDIDRGESLPVPLPPVQQKYLSLEGYTVSSPGQRPGIADGKERLAWRAIRPRSWRVLRDEH